MRILVVGQSPSKWNEDKDVPFEGTKSGKTLWDWIDKIDPTDENEYDFVNCSNDIDKKFKSADINEAAKTAKLALSQHHYDRVFALGKIAHKVLAKAGVHHFKLPHPSGLNRKLNNTTWVSEQLEWAQGYLWNSHEVVT